MMTLSPSPAAQWPNRRQRILTLAKSLVDDLEFEVVDVDVVDGEFYWRICRDELLDPLSRLAASIAPHVIGEARHIDLSVQDQERIEELRDFLESHYPLDLEMHERSIDLLMRSIQAENLAQASSEIVTQLPDWVWRPFSQGLRIAMPPQIQVWAHEGTGAGKSVHRTAAIQIFRIADGQIAESWAVRDDLGALRQLGHLPAAHPST